MVSFPLMLNDKRGGDIPAAIFERNGKMNYVELKQRYINHLASMDLNTLNMMDLFAYSNILCALYETERGDYMSELFKNLPAFGCVATSEVSNG